MTALRSFVALALLSSVASCQWVFTSSEVKQDAPADFDAVRAEHNIVFVTAEPFDGNLGGVAGADMKCQAAAKAGGLPSPQDFIAMLGAGGAAPFARLNGSRSWLSPSGRLVADISSDFVEGRLINPANENQYGSTLPLDAETSRYWTGNNDTNATAQDCNGWASTTGLGDTNSAIRAYGLSTELRACNISLRLLCASVGKNARLDIVPSAGKIMFVTNGGFSPMAQATDVAGAAADALCAQEAGAVPLPGTYVALITFSDRAAVERLNPGDVYRRTDGVRLGPWGAPFDTFVNRGADRKVLNVNVWTGSLAQRTAENCGNWVMVGQRGEFGSSYVAGTGSLSITTANCDRAFPIYCGQQ